MAKQQPARRPAPAAPQPQAKRPASATPRRETAKRESIFRTGDREILYTRQNFIFFGIGLGLVLLGLALMTGGRQEPDTWNAGEIYSFRRITLAPLLMVAGFVVVAIGIFKRTGAPSESAFYTADDNNPPAAE